jgi:shikimate kinase
MKLIIILIGPKGSGKTYLGALLERYFNITFLRVEPIFLKLKEENLPFDEYVQKGFNIVRDEIKELMQSSDKLVFETTGAVAEVANLINSLKSEFRVIKVKLDVPAEMCWQRFKSRDSSSHIPVSDNFFNEINAQVGRYIDGYDYSYSNYGKTDAEVILFFKDMLASL